MKGFFVLKIYCIPHDIEESDPNAVSQILLTHIESDIKTAAGMTPIPDLHVGISLIKDVSDFQIGDVIWAEGEFRGDWNVGGIPWEVLDHVATNILSSLHGFVINYVNPPQRLQDPGMTRCQFLGVTVGTGNGHVTATRSLEIQD